MPINATVIEQTDCNHGWQRIRIQIPNLATSPQPGQHLIFADQQLAIMQSDNRGNIDCLLSPDQPKLTTGPIKINGLGGQPLQLDPRFKYPLLIGQNQGIASMIFFSATIRRQTDLRPLVLLGSHRGFPFRPQPSQILVSGLAVAAAPLLENWKVASRLATTTEQPGCHEGTAVELAANWLSNLNTAEIKQVAIYVSGDAITCQSAAQLATEYRLVIQSANDV
ncbi:MAG: hypothetical protein HY272_06075 [Gammaproteobacteria bacterium]|nr:hypothetical protein [Gammaproteobacteria bacterium]